MKALPNLLDIQVRKQINEFRAKNNLPELTSSIEDGFSETDFQYVTKLRYTGDYIDSKSFPNLKSLTFDGNPQVDSNMLSSVLSRFPNLEELHIKNQRELNIINFPTLKFLKSLEITSNNKLYSINNLKEGLINLKFFDNPLYRNPKNICDYMLKNIKPGMKYNIDVLYYPEFEGLLNQDISSKQDVLDSLSLNNIKWSEKITEERKRKYNSSSGLEPVTHTVTYNTTQINTVHQKAISFINSYINPGHSDAEKFMIAYYWMCQNVKFDNPEEKDEPNGTINAFISKTCNYQGCTKSFQYLIKVLGIKSAEIKCDLLSYDPLDEYIKENYFIIKALLDGAIYYFDIRQDGNRFQNTKDKYFSCFMLSIEDVLRYHRLNEEIEVFSGDSMNFKDKVALSEFAENRINLQYQNQSQANRK